MHIYGPKPIRRFIEHQLECTHSVMPYPIHFHEFDEGYSGAVMENESLTVSSIPLDHRIPTLGYIFKEKEQPPHILPAEMRKHGIPFDKVPAIKNGESVQNEKGEKIPAHQLTRPAAPPRTYVFMSDTRYNPDLAGRVEGADLLYHEATFLHELLDRAEKTKHTTAREAGQFASAARVDNMIVGHFSTRYQNLDPLLEEAKNFFSETMLAIEGNTFEVFQKDI